MTLNAFANSGSIEKKIFNSASDAIIARDLTKNDFTAHYFTNTLWHYGHEISARCCSISKMYALQRMSSASK